MQRAKKWAVVAMGFIAALFASPLPLANVGSSAILFERISGPGVGLRKVREIDFGTVARSDGDSSSLLLSCGADGIDTRTPTPPGLLVMGNFSCAEFTVTGIGRTQFQLRVDVKGDGLARSDDQSSSFAPSLKVYSGGDEVRGLEIIGVDPKTSSELRTIEADESISYRIGGNLVIPADAPPGDYIGEFTVEVLLP